MKQLAPVVLIVIAVDLQILRYCNVVHWSNQILIRRLMQFDQPILLVSYTQSISLLVML